MTGVVVGVATLLAVLMAWPDHRGRLRRLVRTEDRVEDIAGGSGRAGGRWWGQRRRPVLGEVQPALVVDLVAAALTAGSPPELALKVVGEAVGGASGTHLVRVADRLRLGSGWQHAWEGCPDDMEPLRRSLAIARATGAPAAGLLHEAAQDTRRRVHRAAQVQAARLGVRLVLPLGLCALPAFVCWAVVPVVLSLAGDLAQAP
ncbi:MAG: type II secretion system F family protein [Actinomycetes bacterium]